jgi:two-component system, NarL family, nitrate/nitrite response regulator NarL
MNPNSRSGSATAVPAPELRPLPAASAKPLKVTHPPTTVQVRVERTRILIVEDHQLVREGLRRLLDLQPDFLVIGEARDGDEALRLATELQPDVMLLDFSMPNKSGLDVIRELGHTRIRTILLTAGVKKPDVLELLQRGVRGVVLKGAPTDLLYKGIRSVQRGEVWIGREMVADVVEQLATQAKGGFAARPRDFGLTPRELEILRPLVEGDTNKGIAERLSVGLDTVKHHLTNIFDKTGASNRLELALFALHHGLVKE